MYNSIQGQKLLNKKASKKGRSSTFFNLWGKGKSDDLSKRVAYFFAHKTGPWSSQLIQLLDTNAFHDICNFSVDYTLSTDISHLRNLRQLLALYQKCDDVDLGIDRESVAWEAFAKSEILCKRTNERFRDYWFHGTTMNYEAQLSAIRKKIASILGDVPPLAVLHIGFGPGSSTTVKIKTSARYKLNAVPMCSREAIEIGLPELWTTIPNYAYLHKGRARVGFGELTFVPKNAKTDRPITIEPLLNTFVQKGIGSYIKRRLLMVGCNLYNQNINKDRAREGSVTGLLATMDLTSASDLISSCVVMDLLPLPWVEFLMTWRTGTVTYDKKQLIMQMEKFSSMGNGFTFELESLIFYACATAVAEDHGFQARECTVFGDDIVLPTQCFDSLAGLLEDGLGFLVNREKSYSNGPFRESCGGDFYLGSSLRPFYVKGRWTNARLVAFVNFDWRNYNLLDSELRNELLLLLPPDHINYGPDGFGDGHIVGVHCQQSPQRTKHDEHLYKSSLSGYYFQSFIKKPKRYNSNVLFIGDDLYPLYKVSRLVSDYEDSIPPNHRRESDLIFALRCYAHSSLKVSSRSDDPYTIRGDSGCKLVKIYTLHRSPELLLAT